MSRYQKTTLGLDVLQNRSLPLNARQRRLLVLVGTEDFDFLNDRLKQQLAPQTVLDELLALNLIEIVVEMVSTPLTDDTDAIPSHGVDLTQSEINTALTPSPTPLSRTIEQHDSNTASEQSFKKMYLEDIKELMIESLQRYCGLMAKIYIQNIAKAQDVQRLKQCQMQWITALQESRIPPETLNQLLKQINYSLSALMNSNMTAQPLSLKTNHSIELDN
jgi:hypothetical protein